jgi:hypothetical protein
MFLIEVLYPQNLSYIKFQDNVMHVTVLTLKIWSTTILFYGIDVALQSLQLQVCSCYQFTYTVNCAVVTFLLHMWKVCGEACLMEPYHSCSQDL